MSVTSCTYVNNLDSFHLPEQTISRSSVVYSAPEVHQHSSTLVDMIYFDYQKAFDIVPHHRLKVRLKALGFKGNMLKWIESFLHQRRQRVTINGVKSDWGSVTSGVPQGSVLGPILFILFVNSISEEVDGDILLFADDTKLYKIIDTDEDQLAMQEDIK